MRTKPDFLYLNGYAPDMIVLLRDLYRAGVDAGEVLRSPMRCRKRRSMPMPPEVSEGVYHGAARRPIVDIARPTSSLPTRLGAHGAGRLRDAGDRLGEPRSADHRQGQGGDRRRPARQRAQDQPGRRSEGLYRRRRTEAARRGQGDQLRGRLRPVRLHRASATSASCRFRYHAGAQGQARVPEDRLREAPRPTGSNRTNPRERSSADPQRPDGRHHPGGAGHRAHAIFAVLRFPNFALASHMTIGAFAGFVANVTFGLPVVPSLASRSWSPASIGLADRRVRAQAVPRRRLHHHRHRLDRADHRARERRALHLRQRAARLRPADPARLGVSAASASGRSRSRTC